MKSLFITTLLLSCFSVRANEIDRQWLVKAIIKSKQRCHELVRNREFYGREIEGEANALLKTLVSLTLDDSRPKPLVKFHYEDREIQYTGHILFASNGQEIETMSFKRTRKIETRISNGSDSIRNPPRIEIKYRTYSEVVCRR